MKGGYYLGGFVCDICGRKRSHGRTKINHEPCSKERQRRFKEGIHHDHTKNRTPHL